MVQRTIRDHTASVLNLGLSADELTVVSTSADRTLKVWNTIDMSLNKSIDLTTQSGGTVPVSAPTILCALKTGEMAGGFNDGTITIWDLRVSPAQTKITIQTVNFVAITGLAILKNGDLVSTFNYSF